MELLGWWETGNNDDCPQCHKENSRIMMENTSEYVGGINVKAPLMGDIYAGTMQNQGESTA